MKDHDILRVTAKALIPLIFLFGLYVQFHGDWPGRRVPGGVIFAAAVILYALIFGSVGSGGAAACWDYRCAGRLVVRWGRRRDDVLGAPSWRTTPWIRRIYAWAARRYLVGRAWGGSDGDSRDVCDLLRLR